MHNSILLSLIGAWLLLGSTAMAANNQLTHAQPKATQAQSDAPARIALVIGNANYPEQPLPFTVNDATDMTQALSELGFDVTVATNVNRLQMEALTTAFIRKAKTAQVALFYFAGHGESNVPGEGEENYLLPVDVVPGQGRSNREISLGVDAGLLRYLGTGVESRISILILDACRTKSVTRNRETGTKGRSLFQGGLTRMPLTTSGIYIAYGAAPGTAAFEEPGIKHGRFTQGILKHIRTPNLTLEQVFKRVRSDVEQASDFQQSPQEESSLRGDQDFYFVDPAHGHGRITRYAGHHIPTIQDSFSSSGFDVFDNIRTTPASSRMHALIELLETRSPDLSVSQAERILSYFWVPARRRALKTMLPYLEQGNSAGKVTWLSADDVTRLIAASSFPGNSKYSNHALQTVKELKEFGKVKNDLPFYDVEAKLRESSLPNRCEKGQDLGPKSGDGSLVARDERSHDGSPNQGLVRKLQEVRHPDKRTVLKNALARHHIELTLNELATLLKEFPDHVRMDVLAIDLQDALPDLVSWKQFKEFLELLKGGRNSAGDPGMPRRVVVAWFLEMGMLDVSLSRGERERVEELLREDNLNFQREFQEDLQKGKLFGYKMPPSFPRDMGARKGFQEKVKKREDKEIASLLDPFMSCN